MLFCVGVALWISEVHLTGNYLGKFIPDRVGAKSSYQSFILSQTFIQIVSENVFDNSVPVFSTLTSGQGYTVGNEIIMKVWNSISGEIIEADFTFETEYEAYSEKVYPAEDGKYSIANVIKGSNISINDILIYPNPATDVINISSANEIQNVSIFNYVGQTIYNGSDIKINTSNFEAGLYLIRIETKEGLETQKITIN